MKRREFITLIGGAAAAWPLVVQAQQPAMPVIGFLGSESPAPYATRLRAFHQGLGEAGYVEGRNVATEYRWAEGHAEQSPALATDLVRRQVSVIATGGTPATRAAKAATTTTPIIFQVPVDPIEIGLVASLNRPGGNLTGVATLNVELGAKRLELLHELVPTATIVALLVNPTNPAVVETLLPHVQAAANTLGLRLHVLHASTDRVDTVFATVAQLRAGGLVIGTDPFFTFRSEQLAALALRHAVPAIFQYREFAAAGGLMSYGGSVKDNWRQVGVYTGRILKGEKPADLPVSGSNGDF